MAKRTKKVSINLTQEEWETLEWLSRQERRTISELAQMILVDNAQLLFLEKQPQGEITIPHYIPKPKPIKVEQL